MKKMLIMLLAVMILAMGSTASAKQRHHDWSDSHFDNGRWHQKQSVHYKSLPFKWHDSRDRIPYYKMERINDHRMYDRFPGLHAYKWHDERGFWYNGNHIRNAVLYYDDDDELVSVGFMRNGTFVFVRDDDRGYETQDDFVTSWLKVLLIHEIARS